MRLRFRSAETTNSPSNQTQIRRVCYDLFFSATKSGRIDKTWSGTSRQVRPRWGFRGLFHNERILPRPRAQGSQTLLQGRHGLPPPPSFRADQLCMRAARQGLRQRPQDRATRRSSSRRWRCSRASARPRPRTDRRSPGPNQPDGGVGRCTDAGNHANACASLRGGLREGRRTGRLLARPNAGGGRVSQAKLGPALAVRARWPELGTARSSRRAAAGDAHGAPRGLDGPTTRAGKGFPARRAEPFGQARIGPN